MKVTGCIPGLAADRSGMILPGDEIVKINGRSLLPLHLAFIDDPPAPGKDMFYWEDPLEGFENVEFLGNMILRSVFAEPVMLVSREGRHHGSGGLEEARRSRNSCSSVLQHVKSISHFEVHQMQRYRWFAIELMRGTSEFLDMYNKCRSLEFRNAQLERPEKETKVEQHVDTDSNELQLRGEIERLDRQVEMLRKKSAEDDAEIEDLKRQNKKLSSEAENSKAQIDSLKQIIEKLRSSLLENDRAAEIEQLKLQLRHTKEELDTTRYNFEQAHMARIQLEATLASRDAE
eukprot:762760-Hanusia_phi.AAC.10